MWFSSSWPTSHDSTVIMNIAWERLLCSFILVALLNIIIKLFLCQQNVKFNRHFLPSRAINVSHIHHMFDFNNAFANKRRKVFYKYSGIRMLLQLKTFLRIFWYQIPIIQQELLPISRQYKSKTQTLFVLYRFPNRMLSPSIVDHETEQYDWICAQMSVE